MLTPDLSPHAACGGPASASAPGPRLLPPSAACSAASSACAPPPRPGPALLRSPLLRGHAGGAAAQPCLHGSCASLLPVFPALGSAFRPQTATTPPPPSHLLVLITEPHTPPCRFVIHPPPGNARAHVKPPPLGWVGAGRRWPEPHTRLRCAGVGWDTLVHSSQGRWQAGQTWGKADEGAQGRKGMSARRRRPASTAASPGGRTPEVGGWRRCPCIVPCASAILTT